MSEIKIILDLLSANKLDVALKSCQELIIKYPNDANLQHLLGLIYAKMEDINTAISHFNLAIKIDPNQAIFHNNISNAYKLIGNFEFAVRHLHTALQIAPNNAESYNNLGSLYYSKGDINNAIPQFSKAIRLNPNIWEAHYNLANSFIKKDMVQQAIQHYITVLKLNPKHSYAKLNLGMAYISINNYQQALSLLEESTNVTAQPELIGYLAECYLHTGKIEQAINAYKQAISLQPEMAAWHHNLAILYLRKQEQALAKKHFNIAFNMQPDNKIAQHMLAALNVNTTANAPSEYVKSLFDQYADHYNQHVKNDLQYNVPIQLRHAINKFINDATAQQYILDLGCGTGLCGIYFRDLAKHLIGVDISPNMLMEAKKLGAYDLLCCCNILETIPGLNLEYFDLVLAADVFVYIGDLNNLFVMLYSSMRNNAMLAFTIEENFDTDDYILQVSGRYAHSHNYIKNLSERYGFIIKTDEAITPRWQAGAPIAGRLFVLTKNNV